MTLRRKERSLVGPSKLKATPYEVHVYTEMLAQLSQATRNAAHSHYAVLLRVAILLFHRGPSAIARFVVAFPVWPSVNRKPKWSLAHIGQESCEGMPPSLANRNTRATVAREFVMSWVRATLNHRTPNIIGWMAMPFSGITMLSWHNSVTALLCKWRALGSNRRSLRFCYSYDC